MSYRFFIDESGDEGIDSSNQFQSKHFILGAFLIHENNIPRVEQSLKADEDYLNRQIHFCEMKHESKVFFTKKLSTLPLHFFGLISDKKGLERGNYREQIQGHKGRFYNKNVKYLLEKVGKFCQETGLRVTSITFDKINNKDYVQLQRYLWKINENPLHSNARFLQHLDLNSIYAKAKNEEPLLKIADVVSNSIYRACTPDRHGNTEHRYLDILRHNFHCDMYGKIMHHGIQEVPRGFSQLNLEKEDLDFLMNLISEKGRMPSLQNNQIKTGGNQIAKS